MMKTVFALLLLTIPATYSSPFYFEKDSTPPLHNYQSTTPPRETVNFDFAWKFLLGEEGTIVQCPDSYFPRNLSGVECMGLQSADTATNANDCRGTCCADIMCAIWQYDDSQGCWIGQSDDCNHTSSTWVGGGRDTPGPLPPPATSGPTSRNYDDSHWEIVDLPHDGLITGEYYQQGPRGQAYLPKNVTWYRKHFNLPTDWKGNSIWVYFEGIFRASTIYLNGELLAYHDSGYTSFYVKLDNASSIFYGDGQDNDNVLAVRASSNGYSGWWYEGGGIYRHTYLVNANPIHFTPDGLYVLPLIFNAPFGTIHPHDPNDPSKGQYAENVITMVFMEIINEGSEGQHFNFKATLYDQDGKQITTFLSDDQGIGTGEVVTPYGVLVTNNSEVWSSVRPYLYTVTYELILNGVVIDAVNVTTGMQYAEFDPDYGFHLNDVNFTWRGFNNHNNFAGVGMAVPDRINLFRAQSMRAVGANSWRMSHNPPIPVMLDIMDRLGIIVWDENREFGDNPIWVKNQGDMVRRDRNHPSIMVWSFCNEAGCNRGDQEEHIAEQFKEASREQEIAKALSANMNSHIGDGLTSVIDVQGFSHQSGATFDNFHKQFPEIPTIGSECCSCTTQRGEDFPDSSKFLLSNFNADCNKGQTENQLDRSYVAGCMVWTLFDYYGEPSFGWPHVSSSFGSIDLAGFAKASAYWYRSWWLRSAAMNTTYKGMDVPINPPNLVNPDASPDEDKGGYLVHIVEHWEHNDQVPSRTIHVYTNAPMAELFINDQSQGVQSLVWQGWAQWKVTFTPGNLTANALDAQKSVLATHTILTTGDPVKIMGYLDVPNEDTGTGSALLLNGQDAGMVSAALLDSKGRVSHNSSLNISFSIVSGPGRIIGVGNGNPACHEPNHATWRSAYHGLARAIVQVTQDHTTPNRHRIIEIDRDGGKRTYISHPSSSGPTDDGIVVQVSAPGVGSSTVTIPVSTDISNHDVLRVAERSMNKQ